MTDGFFKTGCTGELRGGMRRGVLPSSHLILVRLSFSRSERR